MFTCQDPNKFSSSTLLYTFFLAFNFPGFVFYSINLSSPQGISYTEKYRYDLFALNLVANLRDLICLTTDSWCCL